MREVSYPTFVLALQRGTVAQLERGQGRCLRCRRPSGIVVRFWRRSHCPACVPRTRQCARCRRVRDITNFHAIASGRKPRVEPYCLDCRRDRALEEYHEKRRNPPPVARSKECATCGVLKPASAFHRDGRYAGGLEPLCKDCKNERWYEYIATPRGRAAFEAAQAAYDRKHRHAR